MRFVFMGTTEFGIPALEALISRGHKCVGIVSTPARKKGRGLALSDSPLTLYAGSKGLGPVLTPESLGNESLAQNLNATAADVFVVVAFRILPKTIFGIPPLGTYNIHASLLPRYRGPAPVQRAIAAGEKETGVTIFRIDAGIDTGAIILSRKTSIGPEETAPQIGDRLSKLGAEAIIEALALLMSGSAVPIMQDGSLACGAPKLTKAEGKIDWNMTSKEIFDRLRAFKPFPGSYTFFDGMRINIEWGMPLPEHQASAAPGAVAAVSGDGIDVQCGTGVLRVVRVKPEGKTIMPARDFASGRHLTAGMRFA
jgi:methionyl-tRNA formyltransferase